MLEFVGAIVPPGILVPAQLVCKFSDLTGPGVDAHDLPEPEQVTLKLPNAPSEVDVVIEMFVRLNAQALKVPAGTVTFSMPVMLPL